MSEEDVNTEEVAASATEPVTENDTSSAETLNAEKVSETVPYSRFQEVNDGYRSAQGELETLKQQNAQYQAALQRQSRPQQGYQPITQNQGNQTQQQLVDQFGHEGAQAIQGLLQNTQQQLSQQQFISEYNREYAAGEQKHGTDWRKFDYIDPNTGVNRNQVMDLMVQGLSAQDAWNAKNPVDAKTLEQKVRDQVYAEINGKKEATPQTATSTSPNQAPTKAPSWQEFVAKQFEE